MGKPTKTNQIHMTLRPKYGEHQVTHSSQDTKSNLLHMTLRPTEMSALHKGLRQHNTKYTKAKRVNIMTKEQRTPSPTYYKENQDQSVAHYF